MGCSENESWQHSYLLLADQLRKLGLERATLFKRMLFNVLIRNQDDHARNHGFFYDGKKLSYTPAFDLVPDTVANGVIHEQAMIISQSGRQSSIENALSNSERFGLGKASAKRIVEQMQDIIQ